MKASKEFPLIAIVLLPFIYLAYIWNQLPIEIPMQWNAQGEVSRYGSKMELILIPILFPLMMYIIFLVMPKIDPKKRMHKMGGKYQTLKVVLTTLMSVVALYFLYSSKEGAQANPNYLVLLFGVLYIVLGNFFQTIQANYFIGIRTPWTLESESVWHETHRLAGRLFFVAGIIVVLASLLLNKEANLPLFIALTVLIVIVPVVYSYVLYKREEENGLEQGV